MLNTDSNSNSEELLSEFPKFELSYETMMHNKVYDADVMCAIPEGNKCFAWFTIFKDENVCFIFEPENNSSSNPKFKTRQVKIAVTSFNDALVYGSGTILYGTIFKYNDVSCFCIEDIYYYKGSDITDYSYLKKLQLVKQCLETELCSNALTNKFTIFGLPLMHTKFNSLLQNIALLPYKVDKIQYRYFSSKKVLFVKYYKPKNNNNNNNNNKNNVEKSNAIFKVSPQIQTDIYNLFVYKDGKEEFYDIAFIPDYNTSVLMNNLFRNIKENRNLDALEESDDESEFENEKEDKYVFLDRTFKMNCQYNHKFKKWVPISLAAKDSRIISFSLLYTNAHLKLPL
jgi:hypothetical protein